MERSLEDAESSPYEVRTGTSLTVNEITVALLDALQPEKQPLCPFYWIALGFLADAGEIDARGQLYDHRIDLYQYCKRAALRLDVQNWPQAQ